MLEKNFEIKHKNEQMCQNIEKVGKTLKQLEKVCQKTKKDKVGNIMKKQDTISNI